MKKNRRPKLSINTHLIFEQIKQEFNFSPTEISMVNKKLVNVLFLGLP